jgi:hypothetical protein
MDTVIWQPQRCSPQAACVRRRLSGHIAATAAVYRCCSIFTLPIESWQAVFFSSPRKSRVSQEIKQKYQVTEKYDLFGSVVDRRRRLTLIL